MGAQKVTDKILEDARKEAQQILNNYKNEAEKIKIEYEEKVATKRKLIEDEVKNAKESETLRSISKKRLELNKQLTQKKHELVKQVIDETLNKFTENEKYLEFLKQLLKKSGENEGELIINEHDKKHYGPALEKFMKKEELKFKINTANEIKGGVIIKKEKITYIGSLDLISELLNGEINIAIAKILF